MATLRCPYGCVSIIPRRELLFPSITCRQCHRRSARGAFSDANDSTESAIGTANNALAYHTRLATPSKQGSIDTAIMARIERLMGLQSHWYTKKTNRIAKIRSIYDGLIRALMTAEITTNFNTKSLYLLLRSGALKNMWQLDVDLEDEYVFDRDKAEVMAFGQFNPDIQNNNLLYADDSGYLEMRVNGQNRPGYMVLNVGNPAAGGAPMYGLSYVVYRDHIKMRSTYTATDTVQMNKDQPISPNDVVSFAHLSQLFLKMSDANLKQLCQIATGKLPSNANRSSEFIEAQSWGKISLAKDIKAFVIFSNDIDRLKELPKGHRHLPPPIKDSAPRGSDRISFFTTVLQHLRRFCTDHKIELHYINMDNQVYMSTLQPRPPRSALPLGF